MLESSTSIASRFDSWSYSLNFFPTSCSSHALCVYAKDASVAAAVVRNSKRFVPERKGSSSESESSESEESELRSSVSFLSLVVSVV